MINLAVGAVDNTSTEVGVVLRIAEACVTLKWAWHHVTVYYAPF